MILNKMDGIILLDGKDVGKARGCSIVTQHDHSYGPEITMNAQMVVLDKSIINRVEDLYHTEKSPEPMRFVFKFYGVTVNATYARGLITVDSKFVIVEDSDWYVQKTRLDTAS